MRMADPAVSFACDCDELSQPACAGFPFYKTHGSKRLCILHYPGDEKAENFRAAVDAKLSSRDYNFRGVHFPERVDFAGYIFDAEVIFSTAVFGGGATFRGAAFNGDAGFLRAEFKGSVDFSRARFARATSFVETVFQKEARFNSTVFAEAVKFKYTQFHQHTFFVSAEFQSEADFTRVNFSGKNFIPPEGMERPEGAEANFSYATFKDRLRFSGSDYTVDLAKNFNFKRVRVEKPGRISFHAYSLRPHWFIGVNTREFEFTNIRWCVYKTNKAIQILRKEEEKEEEPRGGLHTTLGRMQESEAVPLRRLLGKVYRDIATNCEEGHYYESASKFRYLAMDLQRREHAKGYAFWGLVWWYWLASGYGERVLRAFVVLAIIWFASALLYMGVGFARWEPHVGSIEEVRQEPPNVAGEPLSLPRALIYSAGVMTLQKPTPRPATTPAQTIVMLETILGPVQAALLALAIRRKFMR